MTLHCPAPISWAPAGAAVNLSSKPSSGSACLLHPPSNASQCLKTAVFPSPCVSRLLTMPGRCLIHSFVLCPCSCPESALLASLSKSHQSFQAQLKSYFIPQNPPVTPIRVNVTLNCILETALNASVLLPRKATLREQSVCLLYA